MFAPYECEMSARLAMITVGPSWLDRLARFATRFAKEQAAETVAAPRSRLARATDAANNPVAREGPAVAGNDAPLGNAIDITPRTTATNILFGEGQDTVYRSEVCSGDAVGDPHQLDLFLSAIDPGVVNSNRPEDGLTITRTCHSTTLDAESGGMLIGRAA